MAVQESTSPAAPALLVIGPPPGHVHTRSAPVDSEKTWISRAGPAIDAAPQDHGELAAVVAERGVRDNASSLRLPAGMVGGVGCPERARLG